MIYSISLYYFVQNGYTSQGIVTQVPIASVSDTRELLNLLKKLCQTDTQCEAGGLLQCDNLGERRYWTSDLFYHLEMETLAHKDEV